MIKQIAAVAIVILACLLLSGFPGFIVLITTNINGTDATLKTVMLSGIAFFLLLIGFMGFYFLTRTDYQHYKYLSATGIIFFFISSLGLQWLMNFAYS